MRVSIPQAVLPSCNKDERLLILKERDMFQYRKRYYPVATFYEWFLSGVYAGSKFQYRKRYYPVATELLGSLTNEANRFNTASGITQLQQCPWKSAPGLG